MRDQAADGARVLRREMVGIVVEDAVQSGGDDHAVVDAQVREMGFAHQAGGLRKDVPVSI